jgi:ribosome-associated toxin RatA of RatAB toxin-antitoxin module
MPSIRKTALVPYSSERMYDLVTDVTAYPEFLPWCADAQVTVLDRRAGGHQVEALLRVDFYGLKLSFATRNRHAPPERIDMAFASGPFRSLDGSWQFLSLADDACKVQFHLDYLISSGVISGALSPVFDQIASTMVDAFVKRAEQIHG